MVGGSTAVTRVIGGEASPAAFPARGTFLARVPDVIAALYFVLACAALFPMTADDAFIVERYARQAVRGHGLIFNIGERISALTSPLHALILTALTLLTPHSMAVFKLVGAIAVLIAILYAGRQLFADVWERTLFLSATLGSPFLAMWSVGGLETPLLLGCLTVMTVLTLRASERGWTRPELFLFFILSAVTFLLRHDSVAWVAPLTIAVVARHWRQSIPGVLVAAVLVAAWIVFAWLYYGGVIPTSFYAKAVGQRPPLLGGIGYQLSFLVVCVLPVALLRWPQRRRLPAEVWGSIVLFAMLAAAVGSVHMMFGYRFSVPVLPALIAYYMWLTRPMTGIGRWGFVAPLTVNLALLLVVHSYTVNPTIFHPALFEPHYGFLARQARRGLAYEYTKEGARFYGDFIDALRRTGRAVVADAEARGIARSASFATIIAGATSVEMLDTYVYDNLVGVRRNCPTLQRADTYRAADYFELMVPRFGPLDRQLGELESTVIPVSDIEFEFDGRKERLVAFFNPTALHTPVPRKVNDPCPPGRR